MLECASSDCTGHQRHVDQALLIVIPTLHVGGAERLVEWTAPLLQNRGWRVAVMTLFDEGQCAETLRAAQIPLLRCETGHRFYLEHNQLPRLLELAIRPGLMRGLCHDISEAMSLSDRGVLHAHCLHSQLVCRHVAGTQPAWPYIETSHLPVISPGSNWLNNSIRASLFRSWLRSVRIHICVGAALAESLRPQLPSWLTIAIVPNGIPLPPHSDIPSTGQAEGTPSNAPSIVFVGSGKPQKNLPSLVAAFRIVAAQSPYARLHLCGKIRPQDLVGAGASLEAVQSLIATGQITLHGVIDGVGAVLRQTKVSCLVSRWEALPIAGVEMLYHGNNVVLSDIPPHREISDEGRYAWLVDPNDPEKIAQALKQALSQPVDQGLLAERREWIRANYSIESHVDALEKIYLDLLEGRDVECPS